jgi:NAD(P)-dependent dehydrogenase (short-subunit alcohol dehydrogenase family)
MQSFARGISVRRDEITKSKEALMDRLKDKVAIITGAARGMGESEARLFAREGAKVVVSDMNPAGEEVAKSIRDEGGSAIFVKTDVTSEEDWANLVAETVKEFGKLDILVNNAGISGSAFLDNESVKGWHTLMDVNSLSCFLGTIHSVPEMRKVGGGAIVNTSSVVGLVGGIGNGHPAYSASKGAVRLYTKTAANKYAADKIRVNSVHPGIMPVMASAQPGPEAGSFISDLIPLARAGEVIEVANAVLFLASDEASYVTGAELAVDGGYSSR